MPEKFDKCVKGGGRVRRISHNGTYINVCYPPGSSKKKGKGKGIAGEVHKKKE